MCRKSRVVVRNNQPNIVGYFAHWLSSNQWLDVVTRDDLGLTASLP